MPRRIVGLTCALLGLVVIVGFVPAQATEKKAPVTLKVIVPPDNKWGADNFKTVLKIDDTVSKQAGTTRSFISPPLEPGKKYAYTLTCTYTINNYTRITRKREVPVEAGKTVEVDLTKREEGDVPDDIFVRYVPTPQDVVVKMLELADVKEGEVLWDLGSGDGRIPITAAEKFKVKRALGIELDKKLIDKANENAKKHKVEDKVEFKQDDILKITDYGEANVVTLYISETLNKAIKPHLLKSLKPGSRVVSHRFLMGDDWKPDKTITITGEDGDEYELHLWKIGEKKDKDKEDK